jgi:phage-related protein
MVYRADAYAIVIVEAFEKKTNKTPQSVIKLCKQLLKHYDGQEGIQDERRKTQETRKGRLESRHR